MNSTDQETESDMLIKLLSSYNEVTKDSCRQWHRNVFYILLH